MNLIIDLCFEHFLYIYIGSLVLKPNQHIKYQIAEIKWQKELYHLVYSQEKMTYPS